MLNNYVLIGKIIDISDNSITIENDTDKITIKPTNNIFEKIQKYCTIGGVIGIKGKITTINNQIELTCEKCTFLSSTTPTE